MASLKNIVVPNSTFTDFVHSEIITICVGQEPKQKTFYAHNAILCERSPFFQAALNGVWVGSQNKAVSLPEDDEEGFALWLQIVYTGHLGISTGESTPSLKEMNAERVRIAKAYVTVEKLLDVWTKNLLTESMMPSLRKHTKDGNTHFANTDFIDLIYEGPPAGNPMRRLVVDHWAQLMYKKAYELNAKHWPKDFLAELCVELSSICTVDILSSKEHVDTCGPDKYMESVTEGSKDIKPENKTL